MKRAGLIDKMKAKGEKVNEIEFYLEEIDRKIIRLWNACRSAAVIADTLDIDIEYVQAVIDESQNYKEENEQEKRSTESLR